MFFIFLWFSLWYFSSCWISYHIVSVYVCVHVCCLLTVVFVPFCHISVICWQFFNTHLHLLFLCVEHVRVNAQRSQHAHHQLLFSQPWAELIGCWGKAAQPISACLQLCLPLGCRLISRLPAGVWGKKRLDRKEEQLPPYAKCYKRVHILL